MKNTACIVAAIAALLSGATIVHGQCSLDHYLIGADGNGRLIVDDRYIYRHCTLNGSSPYSLPYYVLSESVFGFYTRGEPGFGALDGSLYDLAGVSGRDYNIRVRRVWVTEGMSLYNDSFEEILPNNGDSLSLTDATGGTLHMHWRYIVWETPGRPHEVCYQLYDSLGGYGTSETFSVWIGGKAVDGDANCDGRIDSADLASWQQSYDPLGANPNAFGMGDFNDDGKVDSADLALWQQNYDPLGAGAEGASVAVPDPATLLLVGTGCLSLLALRRRG